MKHILLVLTSIFAAFGCQRKDPNVIPFKYVGDGKYVACFTLGEGVYEKEPYEVGKIEMPPQTGDSIIIYESVIWDYVNHEKSVFDGMGNYKRYKLKQ